MFTTTEHASSAPDVLSLALFFSRPLDELLSHFLVRLGELLDHRLLLAFQGLCQAVVCYCCRIWK